MPEKCQSCGSELLVRNGSKTDNDVVMDNGETENELKNFDKNEDKRMLIIAIVIIIISFIVISIIYFKGI